MVHKCPYTCTLFICISTHLVYFEILCKYEKKDCYHIKCDHLCNENTKKKN